MKLTFLISIALIIFVDLKAQDTLLTQETLNAGTRPKGDFTSYESKNGAIYRVGDKITIGVPSSNKTFAFITEGDGMFLPITQLPASASGQQVEIKRIDIGGTKRSGFYVSLRCKGMTGLSNYSIFLENAITVGEVDSFGMSSDEALAELKKAKDKLDLGIITQPQYDSIKADLIKYIK